MTPFAHLGPETPALFEQVRALSLALAAPLSDADATVQSMDDASPAKWHLAHTTWFFETFVLRELPGYRAFDPAWAYLFNSYYEAEGPRHARPRRGMLTRPTLDEAKAYRAHVDAALTQAWPHLDEAARTLVELGCHHEQQHQELLLTDILHLFAQNPLKPALWSALPVLPSPVPGPVQWIEGRSGLVETGHAGPGFAFDCEGPRHQLLLHPHALADRTVTNGEWIAFIEDGGYREPRWWLSDGWAWVQREAVEAPFYWERDGQGWASFGLDGLKPVDPTAPVTHISFYEADAYAAYVGARLPTEAEWESAAATLDPSEGQFLDTAGPVRPRGQGLFGSVWEWTGSAYRPYPGFRPAEGAVGEYNGKFMSGQFVLRGGSCATPRGHVRASYRNFFYPHQRWQFTGVRLARDL
ncbi:MAG TPA: ergothioneine biosynthesis protein EgtB [Sphingomonas sp.]|nr:ergothioneine biosynthesis protein EgtB [Sphingomonas sp.]